ncbi:uncharacterized protein LOC141709876 [Apium graveolens]|uniref:uncharacterized protein LOC141709876 n=1 Tax=Apium graveolens TaxID=4045 RepID=UPI003D7B2557
MVDGFPEINEPENLSEACIKGKEHRQSFPVRKLWRARRPLEIIHTDIAGPFDIPSLGVYLLNRCPVKSVRNKTPNKAWSGSKPSVGHFRIFGCIAYAHVPDRKRKKLDDKDDNDGDDSNIKDDGDDDLTPPQSLTQQTPASILSTGESHSSGGAPRKMRSPDNIYEATSPLHLKKLLKKANGTKTWMKKLAQSRRMIHRSSQILQKDTKQLVSSGSIKLRRIKMEKWRNIRRVSQNQWKIFQMDVINIYLEEEVSIEQPPGYVQKGRENKVYRLKEAQYGVKQAPRAWNTRVNE